MTRITPRCPSSRLALHLARIVGVGLLVGSILASGVTPADEPEQAAGETSADGASADGASTDAVGTPAMQIQPHLPSDQIAAVFRTINPRASIKTSGAPPDDLGDDPENITNLIEQLGSPEFAAREQATGKLRDLGTVTLPTLRQTAQEHPDLEVRMRAGDVANGIEGGETAGRIDAFLAGKSVPVDGWEVARQILGDGVRIRELYVDFLMRHGQVAAALSGTSQQRSTAFETTIIAIRKGMFVERRLPTEADLMALLLLANDHDMPISNVEEDAIFTTLRRDATNKLLSDAQLTGPFRALLGGWVLRADVSNRQELLWFALSTDLTEALPLALSTLTKPDENPMTIGIAMQAIARFGDKQHIPSVVKFLSDERPASEQQYAGGNLIQAQVRDAAAATLVLLNDRSLSDFGLNENALHPRYAFIVQEIGFPIENPKFRTQVIEKIKTELTPPKIAD